MYNAAYVASHSRPPQASHYRCDLADISESPYLLRYEKQFYQFFFRTQILRQRSGLDLSNVIKTGSVLMSRVFGKLPSVYISQVGFLDKLYRQNSHGFQKRHPNQCKETFWLFMQNTSRKNLQAPGTGSLDLVRGSLGITTGPSPIKQTKMLLRKRRGTRYSFPRLFGHMTGIRILPCRLLL